MDTGNLNNYGILPPDMRDYMILAQAKGDLNGDKVPDTVYLAGTKEQGFERATNITLIIRDGASGNIAARIPLKENAGYDPQLFLGDFTGDGIDDILISIATGGSGGTYFYYIYSFVSNRAGCCLMSACTTSSTNTR